MKIITRILVLLLLAGATTCRPQATQPEKSEAERLVGTFLANNGNAPIPSFTEKHLVRLGDGAALGVIQYIGARSVSVSDNPLSPQEIKRVLWIVHTSFARPSIIEAPENRTPKATLILLRYLGSLHLNKELQDELLMASSAIEKLKAESNSESK